MKKAFTLAEVLITLAIVGVVAAITIPSVVANAQQQEFKTGLRKAVSVLNEAIQANIAIEGETPYENVDLPSYLIRHMSIASSHLWRPINGDNAAFYTTDGMRFETYSSRDHLLLHESGISLSIANVKKADYCYPKTGVCHNNQAPDNGFCGSYGLKEDKNKTNSIPCIILVDVNGDRKPNPTGVDYKYFANGVVSDRKGRPYVYPSPTDKRLTDVFNILITEDRAIPFGVVAQRAMYEK